MQLGTSAGIPVCPASYLPPGIISSQMIGLGFRLLAQFGECGSRQPRQCRVVEAAAADRLGDPVVDAAFEQQERIGEKIIGAEKIAPLPIGQEAAVTSSANDCSISSNRSNGSRPSRSSLWTKVMIGTSRNRQTSKSLRVCSSMPPWRHWGGVEHHDGAVDRGQGAVGVLAEILVARRIEQVEDEALMLEGHHRR